MWKAIKKKFSALGAPFKKLKAKYKDRKEAAALAKLEADLDAMEKAVLQERKKTRVSFAQVKKIADSVDEDADVDVDEMISYSDRILQEEKALRANIASLKASEKDFDEKVAEAIELLKKLDV